MALDLTPDQLLTTTRSVRKRLDFDRPVEREVADLLGIPYARCTQGGLFPIAYTKGTDFKPGARNAAEGIVHWDTW